MSICYLSDIFTTRLVENDKIFESVSVDFHKDNQIDLLIVLSNNVCP